ncbi:hypothetical protein [Salinithrix halophila]|uniref:Uncharacterized protein n=1 Tax=Salinithrix halophila TaxID=1485204 RepID=A0ABV8JFC8_9BACL
MTKSFHSTKVGRFPAKRLLARPLSGAPEGTDRLADNSLDPLSADRGRRERSGHLLHLWEEHLARSEIRPLPLFWVYH